MSHRLMRIAALATVAGCATALFGPTALGQPQTWLKVPPPPLLPHLQQYWQYTTWWGSATCTVTATSPKTDTSYSGTETHKWEIIPWDIYTDNPPGTFTYFAENWTATGTGMNSTKNWTVNAHSDTGPGFLKFWLPPGSSLLNIGRQSSQQTSHNGSTGGNSTQVWELNFPGSAVSGTSPNQNFSTAIVASQGVINSVQGSSSMKSTGIILTNEPNDGVNSWTCSWNFQYGPPLLSPVPPHKLDPAKR